MNRIQHIAAATAVALQISLLCAAQTALPQLISQLEWAEPDLGRKVISELLKGGEPTVAELTKQLGSTMDLIYTCAVEHPRFRQEPAPLGEERAVVRLKAFSI